MDLLMGGELRLGRSGLFLLLSQLSLSRTHPPNALAAAQHTADLVFLVFDSVEKQKIFTEHTNTNFSVFCPNSNQPQMKKCILASS